MSKKTHERIKRRRPVMCVDCGEVPPQGMCIQCTPCYMKAVGGQTGK